MIHTVKGLSVVNEAEVDFFFQVSSCFFYDPQLPESTDVESWLVVYDKIHFISVFPNYKAFLDKLYLVLKDAILTYY